MRGIDRGARTISSFLLLVVMDRMCWTEPSTGCFATALIKGLSGLFLLFGRSCGSIFDRTFDLDDRGLGGRLGVVRSFGLAFRSTVGLVGFCHGSWRVMKDAGGG